jgi:hypothetical protein
VERPQLGRLIAALGKPAIACGPASHRPERSQTRGVRRIRAMATVENVVAGARAVFFSVAYPDPGEGFTARDASNVFEQLDALFRASRAVTDPQWLGSRAEILEAASDDERLEPPQTKPAQQPLVRRIHMDWRHIEVVSELPFEFVVGGGLVGLVTMMESVAGTAPNVAVRISQLSVEQADWKKRRTESEQAVIDHMVNAILAKAPSRPGRSQLYLGEEDELEGWTA